MTTTSLHTNGGLNPPILSVAGPRSERVDEAAATAFSKAAVIA